MWREKVPNPPPNPPPLCSDVLLISSLLRKRFQAPLKRRRYCHRHRHCHCPLPTPTSSDFDQSSYTVNRIRANNTTARTPPRAGQPGKSLAPWIRFRSPVCCVSRLRRFLCPLHGAPFVCSFVQLEWGIDNDDDDSVPAGGQNNTIKSVCQNISGGGGSVVLTCAVQNIQRVGRKVLLQELGVCTNYLDSSWVNTRTPTELQEKHNKHPHKHTSTQAQSQKHIPQQTHKHTQG